MSYEAFSCAIDRSAEAPDGFARPADPRDSTSISWSAAIDQYAAIQQELAQSGGALGAEAQCDLLWDQQTQLVRTLAAMRAETAEHIAQKLETALAMADETADAALRALLVSAISDLRA